MPLGASEPVLFASIKRNTLPMLRISFELDPYGAVPLRKIKYTPLNTLAFCLRIVLKYLIEVLKALDLITFHLSRISVYFEENKRCCCCFLIRIRHRQHRVDLGSPSISSCCNFKNYFHTVITSANIDIVYSSAFRALVCHISLVTQ